MTLRLNKFCCCCTTRTGTLVIGTLGWILTLMQLFAGVDPNQRQRENELHKQLYGNSDYQETSNFSNFQNNIYFKIGYGLVAFLVCILLVAGVYKKNKRYMLPWLVLKGLEATLIAIGTIIIFFIACIHGEGVLFAIFFVVLLITVLNWYFWLCVWSHYKDLDEEPQLGNTAAYTTANIPPPQYMEKSHNMA